MPGTIIHKVLFKNTSPKDLYDLYMNSKKHSIAQGLLQKSLQKKKKELNIRLMTVKSPVKICN